MNKIDQIRTDIMDSLNLTLEMSEETVFEQIDENIRICSKKYGIDVKSAEKLRMEIYRDIRQLGILQELIDDPSVTEIMVNGTDAIFIEKQGKLQKTELCFESKDSLKQIIWQITARCNRVVNEASPIVDARLSDGARVNVVLDPVALNGPILTIRRFPRDPITMDDLIRSGSISEECADFLKKSVRAGLNILVSGGTGSGKTTMLNVLSNFIPEDERVITIEDSAELQLRGIRNLVSMETRNANVDGCKEITIRDLIKTSLRMRPDRIIVGEVRSKEAIDMLQSVNVGHTAMTTVHANSVADVVSRLETMVLMGMEMPIGAIRGQIASGFDLMIHLARWQDGSRKIMEIAEPTGIKDGNIVMNRIYELAAFSADKDPKERGKLVKVGEMSNVQKFR